jgi:hypothetical protein
MPRAFLAGRDAGDRLELRTSKRKERKGESENTATRQQPNRGDDQHAQKQHN